MSFTPPRLAAALLRRVLTADDAEVIAGDLEESARAIVERRLDERAARHWYWRQTLSVVFAHLLDPASGTKDLHHERITMAAVQQDFVFAVRSLRKQPGFAAMAVVMLALGLGATVAIFSLVNAVILKPLPYADPDRLMLVHLLAPSRDTSESRPMIWSYPKYRVFRDHQRAFDSTATFFNWSWNVTGSNSPERIEGELVEGIYFHVLGVTPRLGRPFAEEETRGAQSKPLAVLAHRTWVERFGADPAVLGRAIGLNGTPHEIIGVMPAGFRGLTGLADIWVPVTTLPAADLDEKWNHSHYVVGRRKQDVSPEQAAADARNVGDVVHREIGDPGGKPRAWGATALPLDDERVDPLIRRSMVILLGAVAAVLLIVCINLANLTMVRSLARQRDVAIQLALGASRSRIISQSMAESVVLSVVGGIAAIGVAYVLLSAGAALMPDLRAVLPRSGAASGLTRVGIGQLGLDRATFLFTLFAASAAATMFGLAPAWRASRRDLTATIKSGPPAARADGVRSLSGRNLLIVCEMALALVILASGGLMLKSVARLQATELGFRPESLLSARIVLPVPQYDSRRSTQLLQQLVDRLAARGDVESAAYGSCAPVQGGCNGTTATFPDRPPVSGAANPVVGVRWASPTYFETLGIRVVRGRNFTEQDRVGQPKVVVINESAARQFWRDEDPIGRRIGVGQGGFGDGAEVVGIVADVPYASVDTAPSPDVYLPLGQSTRTFGVIFIRSQSPTAAVLSSLREDVRALDPDLPLTDIRTMEARVSEATWRTRMSAWLLGAFATLAVLLVALGVYGVVSQGVQQRTREIGVRLAVGADSGDIMRLIISRVVAVSASGIVLGLALAVPSTRVLTTLLYQVRPSDPAVLAPLALLLLGVALLAAYLPARRATRVDPLITLRAE